MNPMSRTVVYPHKELLSQSPKRLQELEKTDTTTEATNPGDSFPDKLAKFIPGEVVAFFAPLAATVADRPSLLITAAGVGLAATVGYFWLLSRNLAPKKQPRWYFYLLAAVSFAAWAAATSQLSALIGLDSVETSFMLGLTIFAVPLIDTVLTHVTKANTAT